MIVAAIVLLVLVALLFRAMARAGSKPRRTPKIPRDRRFDTQVVPVIFFRF